MLCNISWLCTRVPVSLSAKRFRLDYRDFMWQHARGEIDTHFPAATVHGCVVEGMELCTNGEQSLRVCGSRNTQKKPWMERILILSFAKHHLIALCSGGMVCYRCHRQHLMTLGSGGLVLWSAKLVHLGHWKRTRKEGRKQVLFQLCSSAFHGFVVWRPDLLLERRWESSILVSARISIQIPWMWRGYIVAGLLVGGSLGMTAKRGTIMYNYRNPWLLLRWLFSCNAWWRDHMWFLALTCQADWFVISVESERQDPPTHQNKHV